MKKLNVSQMENWQGNGNGRDCALRGAAILAMGGVAVFYPAAIAGMFGILGTSRHCFP